MNSWPAKFISRCTICKNQIDLYEPITRWDQAYAHWRCTRGVKKPRSTPREPVPEWKPDGLDLARAQYHRYKVKKDFAIVPTARPEHTPE